MKKTLTYAALLALTLLAPGCRKEVMPAPAATPEDDGSGVYVSVTVSAQGGAPSTKVPTPGEDGDGLQPGVGDENTVHDLNVFFFRTPDSRGLNTSAGITLIDRSLYFENLSPDASGTVYYTPTRKVEELEVGTTYEVVVIANAGDLSASGIYRVDDLRSLTFQDAVTEQDGEKRFLMASAGPDVNTITIENGNSQNNPSTVSVDIERLTARVDCHWDDIYPVGESEGTDASTPDEVKILGAALVNKYTGPTYAFKRVTTGTDDLSSVIYLGDEMPAEGTGPASNYVIDPHTGDVTRKTFGQQLAGFSTWSNDNDIWTTAPDAVVISTSGTGDAAVTYGLIDYTAENIVPASVAASQRASYCTGIVFKARYTPAGFNEGDSFFWYGGKAYKTLGDISGEENSPLSGVSLDEENYSDYGIIRYEGGICYYTYWLRHADDNDPTAVSPMEYATVRNNIYQLNISSVSDIGGVTPEEGNLIIIVTIAPWREDIDIYPDFN